MKNKLIVSGIFVLLLTTVVLLFFPDDPRKPKVNGVSDKVYYQLVEQYFYVETFMGFVEDGKGSPVTRLHDWMKQQKQYEKAVDYAEQLGVSHVKHYFPNLLFEEYDREEEKYTPKEVELIEKVRELLSTMQRAQPERFYELNEEIREELHIKDSYNPFKIK